MSDHVHSLSADQQQSIDTVVNWFKSGSQRSRYITLGGYAGTGKTTLIARIRRKLMELDPDLKVGFASYTGKAARVLRTKLSEGKILLPKDSIGTIHSLIYSPIVNEQQEIVGWKPKEKLEVNLIMIDEASMVDEMIWIHLLSYGIPIIAVGDHGQLPPIKGTFNLMDNPHLRLERIHRQAELNPIIGISIQARENGLIRVSRYSDTVIKYSQSDLDSQTAMEELLQSVSPDTLILCGYNNTRKRLNAHIRSILGFESPDPTSGDRVICLRNNHKKNIFNGMLGTIVSIDRIDESWYNAEISMEGSDDAFKGLISALQFGSDKPLNFTEKRSQTVIGDLFDFGYALTVHKAQGSQAKRVILFEERFKRMDDQSWRRWLYTAVTRAEEELYIFAHE